MRWAPPREREERVKKRKEIEKPALVLPFLLIVSVISSLLLDGDRTQGGCLSRLEEARETVDCLGRGGGKESVDLVENDGVHQHEQVLAIHFKVMVATNEK